uniref:Uncharacterized protein n=1 Tax=Rhodosorus marinus TaxID=101924 RepID=A0A7S0G6E4_9RHOD|mmetsp:Transcript_2880/g.4137  ORF Transcript_2880/g.4137 Transcript_2880/m.4137 type:complete len:123 (+) Transcript_2880:231-599(+)
MTAAVLSMSTGIMRKRLREDDDSFELACSLLGNLRNSVEDSVMANRNPAATKASKTAMRSAKSAKKTRVRPVYVSESAQIFLRNGHLVSEPLDKANARIPAEDEGDFAWNEFLRLKESAFKI